MNDTSHDYHRPKSAMVEQWQSDRAWIEVVDSDGVIHTYQLRARGDRLELSHTVESVAISRQPAKE